MIYRIGGEEIWVLIHVEVQAQRDKDFARRMFTYNYRIFDHYDRPVVSLAVLADQRPGWRPDLFSWELWGCKVGIRFPVVKLLDYRDRWSELEASDNPFAVCTMAHLKTMETKGDLVSRQRWKVDFAKRLYGHGRDRQYVIDLFRFVDWIMALPDDLTRTFWEEIRQFEEEQAMPYVTSVERMGIQQGMREMVLDTLETKFGGSSARFRAQISQIDDRLRLKEILRMVLKVQDIEDLEKAWGGNWGQVNYVQSFSYPVDAPMPG